MHENKILIGWGHQDITPELPVMLHGQFYLRLATEVLDPVTVTALAIESENKSSRIVMVSLDLVCVPDYVRDEVRREISEKCPDLEPENIFLSATHTHEAMLMSGIERIAWPDVEGFDREKVTRFIIDRTVEAIQEAWASRSPGAISYGVTTAVVGTNRRMCYNDGTARMYGDTSVDEFINIEGDCDHNVNLLFTYDQKNKLTGMIVNVPCPSQVTETIDQVSADFWHETRCEIRKRHGDNIYILPQCSSAGDQAPHIQINPASQRRMLELKYGSDIPLAWRQEIANRLADAVDEGLAITSKDIRDKVILKQECIQINLPIWMLTKEHVELAKKEMAEWQKKLDNLKPDLLDKIYSASHSKIKYYRNIIERYGQQAERSGFFTEINIVRLGDIVFATNRFELFLDFGRRIKTRSRALQTFIVQLAGLGTYLAPHRSCGQAYGATPMDGEVGPEGGNVLVEETIQRINDMFNENLNPFSGARF